MAKLQKQKNGQHRLTISAKIVDAMEWEKGEELDFKILDDTSLKIKERDDGYPVSGYDSEYEYYTDYDDRPQIRLSASSEELDEQIEIVEELMEKQEAGEFDEKEETFIICFVQLPNGPTAVHKDQGLGWVKDLLSQQKQLMQDGENQ